MISSRSRKDVHGMLGGTINRRIRIYQYTQSNNKELKDKSGREGFIRNQAARESNIIIFRFINIIS